MLGVAPGGRVSKNRRCQVLMGEFVSLLFLSVWGKGEGVQRGWGMGEVVDDKTRRFRAS